MIFTLVLKFFRGISSGNKQLLINSTHLTNYLINLLIYFPFISVTNWILLGLWHDTESNTHTACATNMYSVH